MKYLNKKIFLVLLPAAVVIFAGCRKEFLNVNNDPNRATDDNITPELLFTQSAHATGARVASANFQFIKDWVGYWSASGDFAIDQTPTSYNIDFSFGDVLWQNQYNALYDLYLTKQKALAKGDKVLAGAAMILSARLWQDLVDIYGDIPYSQAFQNAQFRQPKYDKGADVYAALQKSLDSAILYMGAAPKSSFAKIDIVNHGLTAQWIKLANTLKLRLLIRQSEMPGFNPSAETAKIQSNGGVLGRGESANVNPGYSNQLNKQSPFYATYGLTPTGTDANTVTKANAYFVNLLKSTNDTLRLKRFFKKPSGASNDNAASYAGTVYGLPTGNPFGSSTSNIGPGLARSADQDQWILPSFESLFLKAEAVARGWLPGNAQAAYEDAVKESFTWLGVANPDSAATAYMANVGIANWANAGSTAASQAKFIAYQKYIALGGVDGVEAWSDIRRLNMIPNTGYVSANPARVSNTIPVRLLYPQSEYTTNGNNVKAEGNINQFTSKIFWQP